MNPFVSNGTSWWFHCLLALQPGDDEPIVKGLVERPCRWCPCCLPYVDDEASWWLPCLLALQPGDNAPVVQGLVESALPFVASMFYVDNGAVVAGLLLNTIPLCCPLCTMTLLPLLLVASLHLWMFLCFNPLPMWTPAWLLGCIRRDQSFWGITGVQFFPIKLKPVRRVSADANVKRFQRKVFQTRRKPTLNMGREEFLMTKATKFCWQSLICIFCKIILCISIL